MAHAAGALRQRSGRQEADDAPGLPARSRSTSSASPPDQVYGTGVARSSRPTRTSPSARATPLPPSPQGCQFNSPSPVTIVGANGHFHSRGKEFDIFTWDGTSVTAPSTTDRFYESLDWNDPPMEHADSLAQVPAMGGIRYSCSYQWSAPPDPLTCATLDTFDMTKHGAPDGGTSTIPRETAATRSAPSSRRTSTATRSSTTTRRRPASSACEARRAARRLFPGHNALARDRRARAARVFGSSSPPAVPCTTGFLGSKSQPPQLEIPRRAA